MRQYLANFAVAPVVAAAAGCSILYNPGNLPGAPEEAGVDTMVDAEAVFDADPSMLELLSVSPTSFPEGIGDEGSRAAVLVIRGRHLVKNQTTVEVTAHDGEAHALAVTVDNAKLAVDANGHMLAVPVTFPVDTALPAGQSIRLDVTVTQLGAAGPITRTLTEVEDAPVATLVGADELAASVLPAGTHRFSRVEIAAGGLRPMGVQPFAAPLIVRATASISITGAVQVNAAGQAAGLAGGDGGNGNGGIGAGQAGAGPAGGQPSGNGGGYIGADSIPSFSGVNRSSGGAGGAGSAIGAGGDGGGGGGTVELTAGGTLMVEDVEARGGAGTAATGVGAGAGGGGSGGVVVLRSGNATVTAGTLAVAGVGNGVAGRARIDAPGAITATGAFYRGITFASTTPLITREPRPELVVNGQPTKPYSFYFLDAATNATMGPFPGVLGPTGENRFRPTVELFRGVNQLCVVVEGAAAFTPEAESCVHVAYLYEAPP